MVPFAFPLSGAAFLKWNHLFLDESKITWYRHQQYYSLLGGRTNGGCIQGGNRLNQHQGDLLPLLWGVRIVLGWSIYRQYAAPHLDEFRMTNLKRPATGGLNAERAKWLGEHMVHYHSGRHHALSPFLDRNR